MKRSIRYTLTLWYLALLAMILCVFSTVLYHNVSQNLFHTIDEVLASESDGVADTIFAFWEAARTGTTSPAPRTPRTHRSAAHPRTTPRQTVAPHLQLLLDRGGFPALITRWAEETGELASVHPIRIVSLTGNILASSANFTTLDIPLSPAAIAAASHGTVLFETVVRDESRIRLIVWPVIEAGRAVYAVQVGSPLSQADTSLDRLRLWLYWLIPGTLVVASLIGWLLATIALQPVAHMTATAMRIGVAQLHERIAVPHTGDELERLATTFNAMLTRLERSFRRLRQFSAAASHELRTPLTALKGELEVTLRRPRTVEEYQAVITTQLATLDDMAQTVEELLALSRSEDGDAAIAWHPVELGALAAHVFGFFRTRSHDSDVALTLQCTQPVWMRGERRLLERVLANLIDNALKHTTAGQSVLVELSGTTSHAILIVRDTGAGISEAELPHIFDRFFRQRPTPTDGPQSSYGLGLGLCRWIAEAHHGRITVESRVGHGTIFTVSFPTAASAAA